MAAGSARSASGGHFEEVAFEVGGFRHPENDRMVRALGVAGTEAGGFFRVDHRVANDVEKDVFANVVRAAKSGEESAVVEKLCGAKMDFFVAAEGIVDSGSVAGEAWRVKDDQIVTDAAHAGGFEPIEDIGFRDV